MKNNLKLKGPRDRNLISLTEDWEVKYWAKKYGVTTSDLSRAVNAVGHAAKMVHAYLISMGLTVVKPIESNR